MAVGGGGGGSIANLQVVVGAQVAGALLGFQTLQGAINAVVGSVEQFVSSGIQMNSFLESSELQFKTLTGSATAAHDKVSELFDLAAHTPFTFESVTVAARQLEVFGGAALDTEANLRMLGDSAAATAAPIEQVTFWTGRLYSALQAGEPIGMATMWLQRMGVLSASATQQMKALSDAGASADVIWQAFTASMGRFSGAMKEQEGTWKGLTSTMSDTFSLLTGEATHSGFVRLEGDLKRVNAALASPEGHQFAQTLNQAFDANVRFAEILGTGVERATGTFSGILQALHLTSAAVDDMGGHFESAGATIASVMEASVGEMAKAPPIINQVRDSWASAAQEADHLAQAARNLVLERAKSPDLGGGDSATRAADQAAHDAEMKRLYDEGQALAHQGDIADIVNKEEVSAATDRAKKIDEVNKQNAQTAKEWFNAAADDIRQKNQETADAMRAAQQASQESIRRAYVETADEAVAQYQRIANATPAPADTLQQQIDEATNRQVRAGIAGTADAEKQLDDIRKAHLKTLPDLVAMDKQYADAQRDSRAADLAVAAAERDLAVALAASGGQQTLQTAELSHVVTAKKDAAAAAHDHAQALSAERSQAISDTNALKDVASANKDVASATQDAVKGFQDLGGGAFDAIASGAASASIAMNTLKAAVRSTQTELGRLQEQADRASMIGQQQGITSQLSDLDTKEKTLPLQQQLLPLEQQMDLLKLAREETTHKERQKQLDKDIAAVQLKIDEIQTQIGVKQREGQARALEQELRVIPYQRQRLWMENDILDVKEKQLDVQMAINNAERATLPPNGVVTPPFFQLTESGWRATPQQGVSVNFNAPVYGSAEFDQRVKQAVETLDRTNNLRFTRYAPR